VMGTTVNELCHSLSLSVMGSRLMCINSANIEKSPGLTTSRASILKGNTPS